MGLDGVELVMAIEKEFQIAISDSEAAECGTVGKLVKSVHSRLRPKVPKYNQPVGEMRIGNEATDVRRFEFKPAVEVRSASRGPAADFRRRSPGMVARSVRPGTLSPRTCTRQQERCPMPAQLPE